MDETLIDLSMRNYDGGLLSRGDVAMLRAMFSRGMPMPAALGLIIGALVGAAVWSGVGTAFGGIIGVVVGALIMGHRKA